MTEEERSLLIAFLDGELDQESIRHVEGRLASDPVFRAEADAFRRTWDLLDFLPRAEPSPEFTHRTLDRVTAQRAAAVTSLAVRGRWERYVFWTGAAVAAAVVGFLVVSLLSPRKARYEDLVYDLRVLENRRLYEVIGSVEFLEALEQADLFGDDSETGG